MILDQVRYRVFAGCTTVQTGTLSLSLESADSISDDAVSCRCCSLPAKSNATSVRTVPKQYLGLSVEVELAAEIIGCDNTAFTAWLLMHHK